MYLTLVVNIKGNTHISYSPFFSMTPDFRCNPPLQLVFFLWLPKIWNWARGTEHHIPISHRRWTTYSMNCVLLFIFPLFSFHTLSNDVLLGSPSSICSICYRSKRSVFNILAARITVKCLNSLFCPQFGVTRLLFSHFSSYSRSGNIRNFFTRRS